MNSRCSSLCPACCRSQNLSNSCSYVTQAPVAAAQNFGAALGGARKKKAKAGAKAAAPLATAGGRIDRFLAQRPKPAAAAAQLEPAQQVSHPPRL